MEKLRDRIAVKVHAHGPTVVRSYTERAITVQFGVLDPLDGPEITIFFDKRHQLQDLIHQLIEVILESPNWQTAEPAEVPAVPGAGTSSEDTP